MTAKRAKIMAENCTKICSIRTEIDKEITYNALKGYYSLTRIRCEDYLLEGLKLSLELDGFYVTCDSQQITISWK